MSVSTHVLDTTQGRPAKGVPVTLSHRGTDRRWTVVGRGVTDTDGRIRELSEGGLSQGGLTVGVYRLDFDTAAYFVAAGTSGFYPEVSVMFNVSDPAEHLHIPLLLSPFGYATYKGV
ncbi:MAG: hydroxyisourate hydrolase [Candidatus Dormibacteraeota bacterium]|nr:hydroxyisourate hydrolase [Candidatus Dormibacteraeota bacterium]